MSVIRGLDVIINAQGFMISLYKAEHEIKKALNVQHSQHDMTFQPGSEGFFLDFLLELQKEKHVHFYDFCLKLFFLFF